MQSLLDPNPAPLKTWLKDHGYPAYRAAQIRKWIYERRAKDFGEMNDLPKKLRDELAAEWQLWTASVVKHQQSADGTEKLLLELAGGDSLPGVPGRIECVLLRDGDRRSICISSQVGCAMGCVFCASGLDGVDRNLTAAEIIEQMLLLQRLLPAEERLSHIVVMGMGEPLANLDNVLLALDEASADDGLGISHRRITISTVGLPKQLHQLCERNARYHLAVSLHAPNDELRNQIVPVNKNIGLDEVIAAADRYFEVSGRRLTFEYVLLAGINDQPQHAKQLVSLLAKRTALLNVIPYNPVAGLPYQTPSASAVNRFRDILIEGGINIKFRQRKGAEIDAACGQLRRSTPAVLSIGST
ncbi:23S rRNA (adenine(2503)-C(2))-methyltransferase RlmN [Anatilimnocola sp. NA78]